MTRRRHVRSFGRATLSRAAASSAVPRRCRTQRGPYHHPASRYRYQEPDGLREISAGAARHAFERRSRQRKPVAVRIKSRLRHARQVPPPRPLRSTVWRARRSFGPPPSGSGRASSAKEAARRADPPAAIVLETAGWPTRSCVAAPENEPASITRTNVSIAERRCIVIPPGGPRNSSSRWNSPRRNPPAAIPCRHNR